MQGLCMLRSQTYILEYYSVLTLQWKFCFKNICVVVTASASSRFIFRSARLWMIGWHVFKCPFSCVGYVRMKHNSCESKNLQPIFNTVIVTCPNSLEPSSVNIFLFTAGGKCVYIGFRFFFFLVHFLVKEFYSLALMSHRNRHADMQTERTLHTSSFLSEYILLFFGTLHGKEVLHSWGLQIILTACLCRFLFLFFSSFRILWTSVDP